MTFLLRARQRASRVGAYVGADFSLVAHLVAWRIALPVLKHVLTVATLARLMWWRPEAPADNRLRAQHVALVKELMANGGRLLVSTNCLERSLVLYRLLSRADAGPTLVLGLRKNGRPVAGHAWIEVDGEPLGEPDRD
jgi:hypothetical protein